MKKTHLLQFIAVILCLGLFLPSCTDLEEYGYGIDSDGDGWTDSQETKAGTDPNDVDSDKDGYWDSHDANPLDPDITGNVMMPESEQAATPAAEPKEAAEEVSEEPQPEEVEAVPLPLDAAETAVMTEMNAVQEAVDIMMRNNGLSVIENPVTVPTANMQRFPDITTAHGAAGVGYVLYLHDYDGNGSPDTNYYPSKTTNGTYICDRSGKVTQVTTGYEE